MSIYLSVRFLQPGSGSIKSTQTVNTATANSTPPLAIATTHKSNMLFSSFVLPSAILLATVLVGPLTVLGGGDNHRRICQYLDVQGGGCIRCRSKYRNPCLDYSSDAHNHPPSLLPDTKGFDVTGVVTEVDLTFPQVKSACDCIQECLNRPTTCANYVYKFSTNDSIKNGHRTCTLYSQFNLPADVAIEIDVNSNLNMQIQLLQSTNNPQLGGLVPQAFKDVDGTVPDDDAVSGYARLSHGKRNAADTHSCF